MKLENLQLNFLNQLSSEILILDCDLNIIWLNDSALNRGWFFNKREVNSVTDQFSKESKLKLSVFLKKAIGNEGSKTKRDFELNLESNNKRVIDLTVRWSIQYEVLILEISCVDNLNKIIDSSKTFSTQKIAANLARTLAHEVKNPLTGIKGSAQILSKTFNDSFSKKFLKIIIDDDISRGYDFKFIAGDEQYVNSIAKKILEEIPSKYSLSQNYPNPFNPVTNIDFALPKRSQVKIIIYNMLGQKIFTLLDKELDYGRYTVTWNGRNQFGGQVSTGVYLVKFQSREFFKTRKMVFLK